MLPAHADDPNALADRLARLQQQQAQQQQRLHDLQRQQSDLRETIGTLQAQLAEGSAALAPIASRAQALEAQLDQAKARLEQDQQAFEAHLKAFREDIRRRYELGNLRWFEFLLSAQSFSDLLNRVVYLDRLTAAEFRVARVLQAERDTLDAQRRELARQREELAPLLSELQARVAALAGAVESAVAYDGQLEGQRRQTAIQIAGLETQGRSLQAALDRFQAEQAQLALRNPGATYGTVCPPAAPAGSVRFCGHGWGHGVGLGQWGADGMALAGYNYRSIAQHFYTQTTWATLDTAHTPIHVAVLWGAGPYRVVPSGPAQLVTAGRTTALTPGQTVTMTAAAGLQKVVPLSEGTRMAVFGPSGRLYHHYRGTIVGQPSGGILYVINTLPIEDYLRGLAEVPSSWPLEAIKAQIVAARCYALTHIGSTALYDVDDTTRYQVYLGADHESGPQNAGVDQTSGEVLLFNGRIIIAFFSASDGGHTTNVSDLLGGSLDAYPYLTGVIDPWDVVAPRHTWYTAGYSLTTLERVYARLYDPASYGHLTGLNLTQRDLSDRLRRVGLVGTRATRWLPVQEFMHEFNYSPLTGTDVLWNEMFGTTPANTWRYW